MMLWALSFLALIQFSFASRYEAHFLDRMLGLYKESNRIAELAQGKSSNLDLKRMARKILRANKSEIKKIQKLRSTHYGEIPEFWILPSQKHQELEKLEGADFDLQFLEKLKTLLLEGKKLIKGVKEKGQKDILESYVMKSRKQIERDLRRLEELKGEINSSHP